MPLYSAKLLFVLGLVGANAWAAAPTPGDGSLQAPIRLQRGELPPGVAAHPFGGPRAPGAPGNSHANAAGAVLPTWSASFDQGGSRYDYTIVGRAPQLGGTTRIDSAILPIVIYLGTLDDGRPALFDGYSRVGALLSSPLFQDADYATGRTQFQDAVQRASFGRVAKPGWHTRFATPRVLTPLQLYVPREFFVLYEFVDSGTLLLQIDRDFWNATIDTLAKTLPVGANELLIMATDNVFLSSGALGLHGLGYKLLPDLSAWVPQTFAWASWLSPGFEPFTDAAAFSHELGEWMNDPFVSNVVPAWAFPPPQQGCLALLESADPLESQLAASYPVAMGGTVYHMVDQVTLAWFSRQALADSPSLAYSFPDPTLASGPSTACPDGAAGVAGAAR